MKITVRIDEQFHPSNMVGLELEQLVQVEATIEEQKYDRYYNIREWPGNDKGLSIPEGDDCIVSIERRCQCKEPITGYSEKYDASYCKVCRNWIEANCENPECEFCKDRPEKVPQGTD